MGRSPGFGSAPSDCGALFGLGFPTAPDQRPLTLPLRTTRRLIMQKARRHSVPDLRPRHGAPTVRRHTVSGSLSLPSRGAFHLSLTVLVRYRSETVFSLRRWSSRIPTGFHVPRGTWVPTQEARPLSRTGLSPSLVDRSRPIRLAIWFLTSRRIPRSVQSVPQPPRRND